MSLLRLFLALAALTATPALAYPQAQIAEPANGSGVHLGGHWGIYVDIRLTNFRLAPIGTCGGDTQCGSIIVTVTTPAGICKPMLAFVSRVAVPYAGLCPQPMDRWTGPSTVIIELVDDSGRPLQERVTDAVRFNAYDGI